MINAERSNPFDFVARLEEQRRLEEERMKDPAYAEAKRQEAAEQAKREADRVAAAAAAELAHWQSATAAIAQVRSAAAAFTGQQTPAVLAVRGWLESPTRRVGLVLRGGVGCGKTTAACYAVREWIGRPRAYRPELPGEPHRFAWRDWNREEGDRRAMNAHTHRAVAWVSPNDLVSAVMHAYDEKSPKLSSHIVLDDMGRETKSDFTESLCTVLDTPGIAIVITTNLTKQQLRERYDQRLIDRLNDTCQAVDVPGKSLRRQDGGF